MYKYWGCCLSNFADWLDATGNCIFKSYLFLNSLLAEESKFKFWLSSKSSVLVIKLASCTPGALKRDYKSRGFEESLAGLAQWIEHGPVN